MAAHSHNPAVTAEQYRLAQAVLSGTARDSRMPVSVAREIVERTPAKLRSEYSRNPVYGMDLDLETDMAPAWQYYDSKSARDAHARLKEGEGKKVVLGHSVFGFGAGGGKKWRMRLADHRGNPGKPTIYEALVAKLGRVPTNAELKADVDRIKREAYEELASKGKLPYQRKGRRGRRNPQPAADDMYASFHGEPSDEVVEYREEEHYHSHLAALGELVEMRVKLVVGGTAVIGFEDSGDQRAENPYRDFRQSKKDVTELAKYLKRAGYTVGKVEGSKPTGYGAFKTSGYWYFDTDAPEDAKVVVMGFLRGEDMDWLSRQYPTAYEKIAPLFNKQKQNPFWPFNSFTHSTIYHVGTGEKYKKSGSHKGYTLYQKLDTGEFLVPALDKESRFDTKKDATGFVDSWTKHKRNPTRVVTTAQGHELVNLYHLARTALSGTGKTSRYDRMLWAVEAFRKDHPEISHKAAYLDLEVLLSHGNPENPIPTQKSFPDWKDAHNAAIDYANAMNMDVALRKVKEFGKTLYRINIASGNDSDYARAEIVTPGTPKSNPKHKGPFSQAGRLLGQGSKAVSRPVDDFLGTAGKVGGYLDDELGRVLNPNYHSMSIQQLIEAYNASGRTAFDRPRLKTISLSGGKAIPYSEARKKMIEVLVHEQEHPRRMNPSDRDTGPVFLTSNENGTALMIVGGDQSLDLPSLGITGDMATKESIVIGEITNIVYHAKKVFDGKSEQFDYTHRLGETTGERPMLIYDRVNRKLSISGGAYKIERPVGETSPGIEN